MNDDDDVRKIKQCGEVLTDVYLIEIDVDGDKSSLNGNITYTFQQSNDERKCAANIQNITDNTLDLSTTVDTISYTLCGYYPSVLPSESDVDSLEWSFNGCQFVEETSDGGFVCSCNHLSFHGISKVHLIEEIEIASLLKINYIFY